ncbi:multicopper oxidase family protein [Rhodobacteraceae bacterium CCMM004]|nr:multicopper oxidase family protein [Rhodobacteraceae bacterium CCMM004]
MSLTRRTFLTSAAALAVARPGAAAPGPAVLEAREGMAQILPAEYPATAIWGYDGLTPGPEIRVLQGGRIERRLTNALPQPTAVHWHGIRIDNAMDGVPGLTQDAVAPGGSFDYAFVVPDAGTFWYHSHAASMEQVARGLHGPLIVEEAEAPEVDADHVLVLDDWRLDRDGALVEPMANFHDLSHAGRLGNVITVNGSVGHTVPAARHARLRLRLINAANARIQVLSLDGLEGWTVALDGMPLEVPQPVAGRFSLAPAQRIDLIVDVTADTEAFVVDHHPDGGYALITLPVSGTASAARRPTPAPLPPNPVRSVGHLDDALSVPVLMEGGAMGGMMGAMMNGGRMGMREMMRSGQFWALNGTVGLPQAPLVEAARGRTVRFDLINDTAFPHGMHVHGHHFREVQADGTLGPWRDTILVDAGARREVAMAADNPGDWLLHCHMLGHQTAGMKTWFRVA